ncbi:MAG: Hsp20/alpha crystallin family protein [Candidatus Binataceae bacterium]
MAKFFAPTLRDFERVFDELFDDLLIEPWRAAPDIPGEFGLAPILDHGDCYEVRIEVGDADPSQIEVEVSERRLWVRVREGTSLRQLSFSLPDLVDRDKVSTRMIDKTLSVMLPKRPKVRRVRLEES